MIVLLKILREMTNREENKCTIETIYFRRKNVHVLRPYPLCFDVGSMSRPRVDVDRAPSRIHPPLFRFSLILQL